MITVSAKIDVATTEKPGIVQIGSGLNADESGKISINTSSSPSPESIPKADANGKLDTWVSAATTSTAGIAKLADATAIVNGTAGRVVDAAQLAAIGASKLVIPGSPPAYTCRAWVNFNGTGSVSIRSSGNVSSISDNGNGRYGVNFLTAMPDSNYSVVGGSGRGSTGAFSNLSTNQGASPSTYSCSVWSQNQDGLDVDAEFVSVAVFR